MNDIILLDGSIGQEVVKRAGDRPTPLWSTAVMMEKPDLIGEIHRDYFAAGAKIATSNTYSVHHDRLVKADLDDQFITLLDEAMTQAETARDNNGSGKIALSLGPLIGSYRPDLCVDPQKAAPLFEEIVDHLGARADYILIETVSSLQHAEGILMGCANSLKPVWLAMTVMDEDGRRLRSGEDLKDLAPLLEKYAPQAVLVNCSVPEAVSQSMDVLKTFGLPFGGYANGFTRISDEFLQSSPTVDALEARTDLDPVSYAEFAMSWVAKGARIIGGCCEVGPAHIEELAKQLKQNNYQIVDHLEH